MKQWCELCEKDTHNMYECRSTHVVREEPKPVMKISGEQQQVMVQVIRQNPQLVASPMGLVGLFPGLGSKKALVQK